MPANSWCGLSIASRRSPSSGKSRRAVKLRKHTANGQHFILLRKAGSRSIPLPVQHGVANVENRGCQWKFLALRPLPFQKQQKQLTASQPSPDRLTGIKRPQFFSPCQLMPPARAYLVSNRHSHRWPLINQPSDMYPDLPRMMDYVHS